MAIQDYDYLCPDNVGEKPGSKVLTPVSLFPLNFNISPSCNYCHLSRTVMREVEIETVNVDI